MSPSFVTRFAPSPTGRLHLGHAYSALTAWCAAQTAGGRFLLRIEDIDPVRCRDAFVDEIVEDLAWLGLRWEKPVRRQSEHFEDYEAALQRLDRLGVIYPCICTRKDIAAEVAASASAPHGPDGPLYPGTCKHRGRQAVGAAIIAGRPHALRLDLYRAIALLDEGGRWPLYFEESGRGQQKAQPELLGDVVLARKDVPTSYHLAVTVDDAIQGISHIIRGEDLAHTTHIHRLLQALLELPVPVYRHHRLLMDDDGQRLAKRSGGQTLEALRVAGVALGELRQKLGFSEKAARPKASR